MRSTASHESDVIFQGASVAFDLSMEEIWLPYLVGATLFVASPEIMGETDRLPDVLEANGVTVLDTVPTLLSVLPRDIASLRLIILGGEACPPTLAAAMVPAGPQDLQFLWTDRDDGRRDHRRSAARRNRDDRHADSELHLLCRR